MLRSEEILSGTARAAGVLRNSGKASVMICCFSFFMQVVKNFAGLRKQLPVARAGPLIGY